METDIKIYKDCTGYDFARTLGKIMNGDSGCQTIIIASIAITYYRIESLIICSELFVLCLVVAFLSKNTHAYPIRLIKNNPPLQQPASCAHTMHSEQP